MPQMIRKHIYIPKSLEQHIDMLAKQARRPQTEVVRDLLEIGLKHKAKEQESSGSALLRLSQVGGTGPKDLAAHHDDYLYGDHQ
jgi:hypothetical protein